MFVHSSQLLVLWLFFALCKADVSCPGCSEISCESIECFPNEYCFMQSFECVSEPCPKMPTCIKWSKVCIGSMPIFDDTAGLTTCTDNCPLKQKCMEGFCCHFEASTMPVTPDLGETDVDEEMVVDGNKPPTFLNKDLFGNKEEPKDNPCKHCPAFQCLTLTCPKHTDAHCVQDNCSCVTWFEDDSGKNVDCFVDGMDGPLIPIFLPSEDTPHIPFTRSQAPTSQLSKEPTIRLESKQDHKATFTPLIPSTRSQAPTSQLSKEPTIRLESNHDHKENTWIYVVIAVCGIFVLCLIGFLVYKITKIRQTHRRQNTSVKQEQKVPLSQVSSDNNNEFSKALINGKKHSQSASTEDV